MGGLAIAGWVLLALLLLLVVALLMPVDLALRAEADEGARASLRVRAFFGLIDRTFAPSGERASRPPRERPERARAKRPFHVGAMLATRGFPGALQRLLARAFRAARVRAWALRVRWGADDPATTGMVGAAIFPIASVLAALPRGRVDAAPDWERASFAASASADARPIPLVLLGVALAFLATPATWRAWRAARGRTWGLTRARARR